MQQPSRVPPAPLPSLSSFSRDDALRLADARGEIPDLMAAARAVRDRAWGRRMTFSPKVFLPLTNLCKNRCSYCSFRKSPSQAGAWTMAPTEVEETLERAREAGCAEALFCLGDKPEGVFPSYRAQLESWGHAGTVDYLVAAGEVALRRGLLPHTNAGLLTSEDMLRLKAVNVSLGLMLECVSPRLCLPGMPHANAPDKRPELRLRMIREAGELAIPFTTGILIGIGETRTERIESLLAIRDLHRAHGHIQEVIVQNFRANEGSPMRGASEPDEDEMAHAVAMARLILDEDVSVQAPPNLNALTTTRLLAAGVNDLGGISPVTPDYINPGHPWPHLDGLAELCAREGYELSPRLAIYESFVQRPGFLDPALAEPTSRVGERIARVRHPSELARESASVPPQGTPEETAGLGNRRHAAP
jgi:FO synthase